MVDAKQVEEIRIFDLNSETAKSFGDWAKEQYGVNYVVCESIEDAISIADIISSATSRLRPVNIQNEWLKKGSLIMFTGAGLIDEPYYTSCKLYFDNAKMHAAYMDDARRSAGPLEAAYQGMMGGQIYSLIDAGKLPAIDKIPSLGDCACGTIKGRESDDERICLMTSGMPIEDVAWSYDCYLRAKKMGLGTTLKLWESPHWS